MHLIIKVLKAVNIKELSLERASCAGLVCSLRSFILKHICCTPMIFKKTLAKRPWHLGEWTEGRNKMVTKACCLPQS